ncbi:MAG: exonuclease subunit SbcC [Nodosilinea sp.]
MIPKHITLTHFLSYREASLDFAGLHVACIAGPNGAGKSSLLEAMAWAIWGQSRVATDDDIIHQGEMEARVAFVFQQGDGIYRIIRRRHRTQGTSLEFQVCTEGGYRALTQKGRRATQELICRHLKLDYDTFINSAYLRQGRADDFMLKRPSERKEILADLLKLHQYDRLAEQAKEHLRQARAELDLGQAQIQDLTVTLTRYPDTVARQAQLQEELAALEAQQALDHQRRQQLSTLEQDYHRYRQDLELTQQQYNHLDQQQAQTKAAIADLETAIQDCDRGLAEAATIEAGVKTWQSLSAEEAHLNQQFQQYQTLQGQQQSLRAEYDRHRQTLQAAQQHGTIQLDAIQTQMAELTSILAQTDQVEAARQQFKTAKARLQHLDNLQLQAGPLVQRQRQLQAELQRAQTRLQTRLEELGATVEQLQVQQTQHPHLVTTVREVSQTLGYLEQRRAYQEQVREKGLERRGFMEGLRASQRLCETQLAQVGHKLELLAQPEATCPLCDRPLDDHHRTQLAERHRLQQQDWQDQIWVIREQLAVSEREIQVLRQEYRAVEAELELYAPALQKQGQLESQLASQSAIQQQIQRIESEQRQLQQSLDDNAYAAEVQAELQSLQHTLDQLAYDDRDHALARGQVDRLRWAEIKHHDIDQARRRRHRLMAQQGQLESKLADLETQFIGLDQGPVKQELDQVVADLAQLRYGVEHHQQVRQALQAAQSWPLRQQELAHMRRQRQPLGQQLAALTAQQQSQQQALHQLANQTATLAARLENLGYEPEALAILEVETQARQRQRDGLLAQLGAMAQECQHLEALQHQLEQKQQALGAVRQRQRVYQELAQAFGSKGIQAMMIENLLPQFEAETNHLLGRLSGHQLHVQFVTQRASKRRQPKLIDTLDILIADARGTRPYETYSGGEAFRINFAIRLALARLLAQRSGLALQLLIIDEGFGTQDEQGCDRLIAAINAIAADFACILTVTHIPHFREAFQTRIDVTKTSQGSELSFSG